MYYEVIEVKDLKIQHSPILQCPNPQINDRCSGRYIHTRKWQIECVECMVLHKTIHKHPLLNKLVTKVICYNEYSIEELIEIEASLRIKKTNIKQIYVRSKTQRTVG